MAVQKAFQALVAVKTNEGDSDSHYQVTVDAIIGWWEGA